MRQFENKVAIVTGGSSGIGKATALELASQGASFFKRRYSIWKHKK